MVKGIKASGKMSVGRFEKEFEDVLENNGAGARILAAFTAIGKWLRCEKELDDIITWRKARTLARSLVLRPDTYDVDPEQLQRQTGLA